MYTVVTKAMKRPYLGNYSDGRDTKITAIPNFIFMFYTYEGFKCNILMILTKKIIFLSAILDFMPQKKMLNTYNLAYVGFGLSIY